MLQNFCMQKLYLYKYVAQKQERVYSKCQSGQSMCNSCIKENNKVEKELNDGRWRSDSYGNTSQLSPEWIIQKRLVDLLKPESLFQVSINSLADSSKLQRRDQITIEQLLF